MGCCCLECKFLVFGRIVMFLVFESLEGVEVFLGYFILEFCVVDCLGYVGLELKLKICLFVSWLVLGFVFNRMCIVGSGC